MYSSTRITQVKAHNQLMTELYPQEIKYSIANSTIYGANTIFPQVQLRATSTIKQELWTSSTTEAVTQLYQAYPHAKIAALNFADYEQTAGGYLNGTLAQEEAICFDSTLFQVLKHFGNYYAWNRQHLNDYLYLDRALYSPKIIFHQNSYLATADVITCAAPFYRKSRQLGVDYEDALSAIAQRMAFVKRLAETEAVDYLVLGAWGAGVFGFHSLDVAKLWKKFFNKNSTIKKVIYAVIPSRNNQAVDNFRKIFS